MEDPNADLRASVDPLRRGLCGGKGLVPLGPGIKGVKACPGCEACRHQDAGPQVKVKQEPDINDVLDSITQRKCWESWAKDCGGGDVCGTCGYCPMHAYEANRQGEGSCGYCTEVNPHAEPNLRLASTTVCGVAGCSAYYHSYHGEVPEDWRRGRTGTGDNLRLFMVCPEHAEPDTLAQKADARLGAAFEEARLDVPRPPERLTTRQSAIALRVVLAALRDCPVFETSDAMARAMEDVTMALFKVTQR